MDYQAVPDAAQIQVLEGLLTMVFRLEGLAIGLVIGAIAWLCLKGAFQRKRTLPVGNSHTTPVRTMQAEQR
jgi:hypothetical protein